MSISFARAVRDETSLLIGIAGSSGSGKTYSALRLATGLADGGKIAMIDTEAKRGLHYADKFDFDHGELRAPFTPEAYLDAVNTAAESYPVIIIDSFSHEHAGEGGLIDMHDEVLERMAGDNWQKRQALSATAWGEPKTRHKRMVSRLLQVRCHLIFCLRAEEKIKFVKVDAGNGRTKNEIVPAGWQPICEKRWPYELTVSVMMTDEAPGVPLVDGQGKPIHGKMQEQHRPAFPTGEPVSETTGALLAEWAKGGAAAPEIDADAILDKARELATEGAAPFNAWHKKLRPNEQDVLDGHKPELAQRMKAAKKAAAPPVDEEQAPYETGAPDQSHAQPQEA